jgi:DMSO/TMAO reductase YedYZ molybdopterin-dependent catalytic subunit
VLGAWAAARRPLSSAPWSWALAAVAALAGLATARVLLAVAELPATVVPRRGGADPAFPARRAFLALAAATAAAAAVAAASGRHLARGGGGGVAAARQAIVLPGAAVPATVPSAVLDATVPGITPFITENDRFFRIDTALAVPRVDPDAWRLDIGGLVDAPYSLSLDDILRMELVEETVTLACVSNEVGGQLVGTATWLGIPLATLLDRAGVAPGGARVVGRSVDGFDAAFPTELAFDGRTALLAVGMNGEPLPPRHGFPARLVVAGLYGYVSAVKWLRQIRLEPADYRGYWIPRGWSELGPVKAQSRIDVPRPRDRVMPGRVAVAGVAWAPVAGVERVELSVDGGPWLPCRLGAAASDETWVQWVTAWDATPGRHVLAVRATDRTGAVQSPVPVGSRPNGAEGHHAIRVTVG